MCRNVYIDGQCAQTQGELQAMLGGELVYDMRGKEDCEPKEWDEYFAAATSPDNCLCPVDLHKTADKHGYDVSDKNENGEAWAFSVYFVKREGL